MAILRATAGEAFCSNDNYPEVNGKPYIKRIAPLDTFYMSFTAVSLSPKKDVRYYYTPKMFLMKYYFREDIEKEDVIYIGEKHQNMVSTLHITEPRVYRSNRRAYYIISEYNEYFDASVNDKYYYDDEYLKSFQMVCKIIQAEIKENVP